MARKQSTIRSPGSQRTPKGYTQGNILVDPNTGDPICVKEDGDGQLRLCTDTVVTFDSSGLDIELTPNGDGVHIGDQVTGNLLVVESDGTINVNTITDAKTGDNIAISSHPASNQIKASNIDSLNTTNNKEVFSYTSSSSNTRVKRIKCTAATEVKFTLKIDGVIEEIFRTSTLEKNVTFIFDEHLAVGASSVVTVEAEAFRVFVTRAPYETFVKLEGYLCS